MKYIYFVYLFVLTLSSNSYLSNTSIITDEGEKTIEVERKENEFTTKLNSLIGDMSWHDDLLQVPSLISSLGSLVFMAHDNNFFMHVDTSVGKQSIKNRSMDFHARVENLAYSVTDAFKLANENMDTISELAEESIRLVLKSGKVLYNGSKDDVKMLPILMRAVTQKVTRCVAVAEQVTMAFENVMKMTDCLAFDVATSESANLLKLFNVTAELQLADQESDQMRSSYKNAKKMMDKAAKAQRKSLNDFLSEVQEQSKPHYFREFVKSLFMHQPSQVPSAPCFKKLRIEANKRKTPLDDEVNKEIQTRFSISDLETHWKLLKSLGNVVQLIVKNKNNETAHGDISGMLNMLKIALQSIRSKPVLELKSKAAIRLKMLQNRTIEQIAALTSFYHSNSTMPRFLKSMKLKLSSLVSSVKKSVDLLNAKPSVCGLDSVDATDLDNGQLKLAIKEKLLDSAVDAYDSQFEITLRNAAELDELLKKTAKLTVSKVDAQVFKNQSIKSVIHLTKLRRSWQNVGDFFAHATVTAKTRLAIAAKFYSKFVDIQINTMKNPHLHNMATMNLTLQHGAERLILSASVIKFYADIYTKLSSKHFIPPLEEMKTGEWLTPKSKKVKIIENFFKRSRKTQKKILRNAMLQKRIFQKSVEDQRKLIKKLYILDANATRDSLFGFDLDLNL